MRAKYTAVRPGYHQNERHWNTVELDGSNRGRRASRDDRPLLRTRGAPVNTTAPGPSLRQLILVCTPEPPWNAATR
ncbi:MAG: hypothetical protein ACRDSL_13900 [Pseudonocardiaceae bacterium]